jgi:hypothetical protein
VLLRYKEDGDLVWETGFFHGCVHVDRQGIFAGSSLSEAVLDHDLPPVSAHLAARSKYDQKEPPVRWEGPVLAFQVCGDRSVRAAGGIDAFWGFCERACAKLGGDLLVKDHPLSARGDRERMSALAQQHGSTFVRCPPDVLDHCAYLLTFCSTLAVDAFCRGCPVAQAAPGYFTGTSAVEYTAGGVPDDRPRETVEAGRRMADFLAWRYCWPGWHSRTCLAKEERAAVIRACCLSDEPFPLPSEFSMAGCLSAGRV